MVQKKGDFMKKKLFEYALTLILSSTLLVGCGNNNNLSFGKPYSIKAKGASADITINGATRTTLLEEFNGDTDNDIVYIDCTIKLTDSGDNYYLSTYDFEGNIRVKDENGIVLDFFEFALPGEDVTVVDLEENKNIDCSFPVVVPMETKRIVVDILNDDNYSNEITLKIE